MRATINHIDNETVFEHQQQDHIEGGQIHTLQQLKSQSNNRPLSSEVYSYTTPYDSTLSAKYNYQYNSNSLKTQTVKSYLHQASNTWYEAEITTSFYNSMQQLIRVESKRRNLPGEELVNSHATEYAYDSNGNTIMVASYSYDGSQWIGHRKYEYAFDALNNKTLDSRYEWEVDQWVCYRKSVWEYNTNSKRLSSLYWAWDYDLNVLIRDRFFQYSYDSYGNRIKFAFQNRWNDQLADWQGGYCYDYIYGQDGQKQLRVDYSDWQNNSWVKTIEGEPYYASNNMISIIWYNYENGQRTTCLRKNINNFNSQNKTSLRIRVNYDAVQDIWHEYNRTEYRHNSNGNTTMYAYYSGMNSETKQWIGSNKNEYEYDAEGRRTLQLSSYWNSTTKSFYPDRKYEYLWDSRGNRILDAYYSWDNQLGALKGQDKQTWVYATDNSLYYSTSYDYIYDGPFSFWQVSSRTFYNYSTTPTSADILPDNTLEFNYQVLDRSVIILANQELSEAYTIKVYALDGTLLTSKKLNSRQNRINLGHLKAGSYIITNTLDKKESSKIFLR